MKAFKILCACLLALPLLACATVTPTQTAVAAGDIGGRIGAMLSDVKAARPHADQYGQGLLDSAASTGTVIQQKDLPVVNQAAGKLATDDAKIKVYESEWIAPRMRRLFWTIFASMLGLWIVAGVLEAFAGESGFLMAVVGFLKAMGTIGGSVVAAIFKWLTSKIVQGSAAISKMHTAAQTLHAVAQDTKLAQNGIVTGGPVVGVAVSVPSAGPGSPTQPIATA